MIVAKLTLHAQRLLQPIRDHYARPVIVTSGYRSPALNSAVGGSSTSQHMLGEASDFTVQGMSNYEVCKWIRDFHPNGFDQLIYEFGESGWIHCSWKPTGNRREVLTATKRPNWAGRLRTVYLKGLHRVD
jgi:uncharacterized protein YcbK (DUF882 family)